MQKKVMAVAVAAALAGPLDDAPFDVVVADPPYAVGGDELGAVLTALAERPPRAPDPRAMRRPAPPTPGSPAARAVPPSMVTLSASHNVPVPHPVDASWAAATRGRLPAQAEEIGGAGDRVVLEGELAKIDDRPPGHGPIEDGVVHPGRLERAAPLRARSWSRSWRGRVCPHGSGKS